MAGGVAALGGGHDYAGRDISICYRHWGNQDELGGEPWGSPSYPEANPRACSSDRGEISTGASGVCVHKNSRVLYIL